MNDDRGIRHFTPGPVEMPEYVIRLGGRQVPYFRNKAFSDIVFDCERMLLELANAPAGSRAILLTSSGTGGMEAAIVNFADREKPSLVINSRGFGQRLVDICRAFGRPVGEFNLPLGVAFKKEHVADMPAEDIGALICNAHDTVTGVLHDLEALADIAKRRQALFIVDAISSFLCDPIDMQALGIDVLITGSQKALALPPGLAILILSPKAITALNDLPEHMGAYYFDLRPYMENAVRGQTPFTPAVGIILQLHARLKELTEKGVEASIAHAAAMARHFRRGLKESGLPLREFPDVPSNAITAVECTDPALDADALVRALDERHGLYVTPNGGELKHRVFRVSHMGVQTKEALDKLIAAISAIVSELEQGVE